MTDPVTTPRMHRRTALGLGAALLVGCGSAARAGQVTWWAMSTEGENAPLLLPAFTAASGIAVDAQALPWTAAHEKILTAYAGAALPDVLMVANSWLAELAMLGALARVPPALGDGLLPAARAAASVDGALRGVPWTLDTQVQFYRRDLLAAAGYPAPPDDWMAWRAMAVVLKRRRPDDYPLLLLLDWPEVLMALGAQAGPLLRERNTRGNFASAGFRQALAFYLSLFADRLTPAIVGTQVGDSLAEFARGTYAVLPASAYTVGDLGRRSDITRRQWAVAALPGRDGAAAALTDGASLVVTRGARDAAMAWSLIRYLTAPVTQTRFHALTGDLPTRAAAWPALAADPVARTFAAAFARGVAPPAVPEWLRIVTEVQAIAERAVRGEFGVAAATREMDRAVDAILAKRRWLVERGQMA